MTNSTIEIDFDVFKALTARRASADVTYNDVLREILGLPAAPPRSTSASRKPWVSKGVTFPDGTAFRARYKGQQYDAVAKAGAMVYGGKRFKSASAAAKAVTGNNVNGWRFWDCRRPGDQQWRLMYDIWKDGHGQ